MTKPKKILTLEEFYETADFKAFHAGASTPQPGDKALNLTPVLTQGTYSSLFLCKYPRFCGAVMISGITGIQWTEEQKEKLFAICKKLGYSVILATQVRGCWDAFFKPWRTLCEFKNIRTGHICQIKMKKL